MITALVFKGIEVSHDGQMVSMTDAWKAGGSDPNKRPVIWLRSSQAQEFIETLSTEVRISHYQLVRTSQGVGTWAHWQICTAYAQYLSPEFHIWCNTVLRQHMEARALAPNGLQALRELHAMAGELYATAGASIEALGRHEAELSDLKHATGCLQEASGEQHVRLSALELQVAAIRAENEKALSDLDAKEKARGDTARITCRHYAELNELPHLGNDGMRQFGKKCSALSSQLGRARGVQVHHLYGEVKTWDRDVCREAYRLLLIDREEKAKEQAKNFKLELVSAQ